MTPAKRPLSGIGSDYFGNQTCKLSWINFGVCRSSHAMVIDFETTLNWLVFMILAAFSAMQCLIQSRAGGQYSHSLFDGLSVAGIYQGTNFTQVELAGLRKLVDL